MRPVDPIRSCYIGQAEEFAAGRAILVEPLASRIALPREDLVFAPVGFIPAPRGGGAVPMCAPGLSLIMAVAWKAGGMRALHLVVPALGALAIWGAYLLGRRVHSATAGACAAVLLAASPVFLYQVVQPMSDVPAAAFWTLALVLAGRRDARGDLFGGAFASLAILTRPNLAPAVAVLAAFIVFGPRGGGARILDRPRLRALLRFVVALAPGCVLLAVLNQIRYGSPFRTGYGDVDALFSLSHVLPNAGRYARWVIEAQTPLVLLALVAPLAVRRRPGADAPAFALTGLAFAGGVVIAYLPYTVFDAWWYTRFLLPALPVTLALASASLCAFAFRVWAGGVILVLTVALVVVRSVSFAQSHDAFALRHFERRYIEAGTFVGRVLPENAVLITVQQSGSVRHYGRRPAALWDALAADALDQTVALFEQAGRRPYFLLEEGEEVGFRTRFAGQRLGALDWAPAAEIPGHVTVRLYNPRDRPGRK